MSDLVVDLILLNPPRRESRSQSRRFRRGADRRRKMWSFYRLTHRPYNAEGKDGPRMEITTVSEIMVAGHDTRDNANTSTSSRSLFTRSQIARNPNGCFLCCSSLSPTSCL